MDNQDNQDNMATQEVQGIQTNQGIQASPKEKALQDLQSLKRILSSAEASRDEEWVDEVYEELGHVFYLCRELSINHEEQELEQRTKTHSIIRRYRDYRC